MPLAMTVIENYNNIVNNKIMRLSQFTNDILLTFRLTFVKYFEGEVPYGFPTTKDR